jgi:hypothetical protein
MTDLSALRAALAEEPTQAAWNHVEALMDAAEADPMTLGYVREHAADWPMLHRLTRWGRFLSLAAGDPRWELVVGVDLQRARLDVDGLDQLLAAPGFARLRYLNLRESDTENAHIWRLLEAAPASLRCLILDRNPLGDTAANYIPEHLQLTDLWLEGCGLSGFGVAAICANLAVKQLTTLHLGDNDIGPEGASALCGCPLLGGVRILSLQGAGLTRQAADLLSWAPYLTNVLVLDVRRNPLGRHGLDALRAGPAFRDTSILHD